MTADSASKRVLYVDFAPSPGGSVQSLLLILRHLPRNRYQPVALLSPAISRLPVVQALDVPVFAYDAGQGMGMALGATAGQIRSSQTAQWVRTHRWWGQPWRWASIVRRLWLRTRRTTAFVAGLIREQRIDMVHMNDALPLAEPGIIAARWARRPSIVTVRSFTPIDGFHRLISSWPVAGIFTSQAILDDQQRHGAHFRREHIIPNAIDLSAYRQPPDRSGVRAELGLPEDAQLVVAVGRIMRRKGLDYFVRAMADVSRHHPAAHGLIIGGVEHGEQTVEAELRDLAQTLGMARRIHFTGFRADVPRLLLASDLLCFAPTEPEPFGRTAIEAMAAGLPVIAARSGALPDIVAEGETGLLVPPADAEAQAAAIRRLLADSHLASTFGEAGRRRSIRYDITHQIDALCTLYDEILESGRPGNLETSRPGNLETSKPGNR